MNYKEAPSAASQADLQQYATGIGQVNSLVESLHSQGLLPERFTPEPSRLHPSLERRVRVETLIEGGKSREEFLLELRRKPVGIASYARRMVESADFTTLPESQPREIAIGKVEVLVPNPKGRYATTEEIWASRDEKGLDEVPAETALNYLLQRGDQLKLNEPIWMSMKTIAAFNGLPSVFYVVRRDEGLRLDDYWVCPDHGWSPGQRVAFGIRK